MPLTDLTDPPVAEAYVEGIKSKMPDISETDRQEKATQEAEGYVTDELKDPPEDIPLVLDERVSCTSGVYSSTEDPLRALWDTGCNVNLVDQEKIKTLVPGEDYEEIEGKPATLQPLGDSIIRPERMVLLRFKCYRGGPRVELPAIVAELRNFKVDLFIGLPGLRRMRGSLDCKDPTKMVLDCGIGGCRHTVRMDASGKTHIEVTVTPRLVPTPPGKTADSPAIGAVGLAALFRLIPLAWTAAVGAARFRTEIAQMRHSYQAIGGKPANVCGLAYHNLAIHQERATKTGATIASADYAERLEHIKQLDAAKKAKIDATLVDLTSPTQHPTLEDCRAKSAHLLDPDQRERAAQLLFKHRGRFYKGGQLPPMKGYKFNVQAKPDAPGFVHKPIPLKPEERALLHAQLEMWERSNQASRLTAREVENVHRASRVFFKTEAGKLRPCFDYSDLNKQCHLIAMQMPDMQHIRRDLAGADWYISMDVRAAFNQIELGETTRLLMVVVMPGKNPGDPPVYFKPHRMGFGYLSSPAFFQSIMNELLQGMNTETEKVHPYIDDVNVAVHGDFNAGLGLFEKIMQRTQASEMLFSWSKLQFMVKSLRILGFIVDSSGISPDPSRCKELLDWPVPRTAKELQGYLGMYQYLASSMPQSTTGPLRELQKAVPKKPFKWTKELTNAFTCTKALATRWVLTAPLDYNREVVIQTDSSAHAMGWILAQYDPRVKARRVVAMGVGPGQRRQGDTQRTS